MTPRGLAAGVASARVILASEPIIDDTSAKLAQAARLLGRLDQDMSATMQLLAASDLPLPRSTAPVSNLPASAPQ
jgi:ABC-type antimicrobial peptide transport system ATPase subunit